MEHNATQCVFSSMSGQLCALVEVPAPLAEDVVREVVTRGNTGWGPERVAGEILRRLVSRAGDDTSVRAGQLQVGGCPTLRVRYNGRGSYTLTSPTVRGQLPRTETFDVPPIPRTLSGDTGVGEKSPAWATTRTDIVVESMLGQVVFSAQMEAATLRDIVLRSLLGRERPTEYPVLVGAVLRTLSLRVSPPGGFTADVRRSGHAHHTLWIRYLTAGRFVVASTEGAGEPSAEHWQAVDRLRGFSSALVS